MAHFYFSEPICPISFDGRLIENIFAYLFVFAQFHHVQTPNIFKALNIFCMKIFYIKESLCKCGHGFG